MINTSLREAICQSVAHVYTAYNHVPCLRDYFPPLVGLDDGYTKLTQALRAVEKGEGLSLRRLYESPTRAEDWVGRGEFHLAIGASPCLPSAIKGSVRTVRSFMGI